MIHVCPLSRLYETVEQTGSRHVVTLLKQTDRVVWPQGLVPDNHLILGMDDIVEAAEGYVPPADGHIVMLGDHALSRKGRMIAAIDTIQRGELSTEGRPFRLELE